MAFKLQFVTISTDTNKRQVLDSIVLDASLSEIHESDAEVTEFPVEQGSDITDNVRPKPKDLQVEALITDFSLAGPSGPGNSAKRAHASGFKGYSSGTLLALEDYQAKGTLIDVETGLKSYQNMVIKNIRTPRDRNIKNGVKCVIILKNILIAQSQNVLIKQADPKGQPAVPKGAKTATAANKAQEDNKTLFAHAVDKASDGQLGKRVSDSFKSVLGAFGLGN